MPIENDATISHIIGKLDNAEEYVRGVYEHMWECKREFGAAMVRIGLMGKGRAPNYRLEYPRGDAETPTLFACYRGKGHRQDDSLYDLTLDTLFGRRPRSERMTRHEHWSSRAMTMEEVATLLGDVRQWRRKGTGR
jgi:hypothetical protein